MLQPFLITCRLDPPTIVGNLHRDGARRWVVSPDGSEWDLPDAAFVHYRALQQEQEKAKETATEAPSQEPQAPPPGHPDETDELKAHRERMQRMQEMMRGRVRAAPAEETAQAGPADEPALAAPTTKSSRRKKN